MIARTASGVMIAALIALAQPPAPSAAALDPLLAKIATYRYGQSRESIAKLTVLVENSMNSTTTLREIESRLLRFLQSDATADAKQSAFKELSRIATEASIPALRTMLTRAETAEMARYALARIPGPATDEVLRKALEQTSGKTKIGIINSLAQRRDTKSVPAIHALTASPDAQTADAAIYALGNIGSRPACDALTAAVRDAAGTKRQRAVEAQLLCAGLLATQGDHEGALKSYRQLNAAQESDTVRIAAITGLASVDAKNAIPALTSAIESKSPAVQAAAIRLLAAIPGKEVTDALAQKFPDLSPGGQVRLLTALAQRGDVSARPVLVRAIQSATPPVQVAALTGLGKLGDESSVAVLAETAAAAKGPAQTAARESLSTMRGANIDTAIVKAIAPSKGAVKSEYILAAGERRSAGAGDALLQTLRDPDADMRRAALRALRKVAGPAQIPGLLETLKTTDTEDRQEAVQALAAALKKSQPEQTAAIVSMYRNTTALETRLALLDVLGQASTSETLAVLREALKDSNPEIVRGSILALTTWPDPTPLPDLLALAKSRPEPALETLALRGYLKLLAIRSGRSNSESARLIGEAIQLARDPAEKRSALSQLTSYPSQEALKIAEAYLKDQTVAVEAKASVERIRNTLK